MNNAMKTALFAIVATALQASAWTVDELCGIVTNQLLYACGEVDRSSFLESEARTNPDVVSEALLRLATNGMVSADAVDRDAYTLALWMMGEFGGTNAIPFLLERIRMDPERRSAAVYSYVSATCCSTNEMNKLIEMIDGGERENKGLVEAVFDGILHVKPDLDLPEEKRAAYVAFVEENAFKYDVSPDFQWADKYLCKYRPGWTDSTNRLAVANRIVARPNVHPRTFDYFTAVVASFEPPSPGEE